VSERSPALPRPPFTVDVSEYEEDEGIVGVVVETLDAFADTEEEGAAAVLGAGDDVLIPEGGDVMAYGGGGAGKTTMMIDLALHLAAGDPWLRWSVSPPLRVLMIENEGPRPFFRAKLRRKRDAWAGSALGDRLRVLAQPWGRFTYADEVWRKALADVVREREIDVVICGPLTTAGMEAAGTLQEVRAFLDLVGEVRRLAGRGFASILVHHESKAGAVSGAWEGAGDTLLHVAGQGHGRLRLVVQKARWASESHAQTLQLVWAPGETFAEEEREELDDETVAEKIVAAIRGDPGSGWSKVEKATPGVGRNRRNSVRDRLLAAGEIVNLRRRKGEPDRALDHVEEAKAAHLYVTDDPVVSQLLRASGAVGEQSPPGPGETDDLQLLPAPRLKSGAGSQEQSAPPSTSEETAVRSDALHVEAEAEREEPS
jgi:AAA domain